MKNLFFFALLALLISSCATSKTPKKFSFLEEDFEAPRRKISGRIGDFQKDKIFAKEDENNEPEIDDGLCHFYRVGGKKSENLRQVSYIPNSCDSYKQQGFASWYGAKFSGKKTASGEVYDIDSMTAAHRTLPMNSLVLVTNLKNQKSVIVRINDRGPFAKERVIDVSQKAAEALDFKGEGVAKVQIELLESKVKNGEKERQNLDDDAKKEPDSSF